MYRLPSSLYNLKMRACFLLIIIFLFKQTSAFVEFELLRNPHYTKKLPLAHSECHDPSKITDQCQYLQLCYEKDIAYIFQFQLMGKKKYLALDMTTPISWIKGEKCKQTQSDKSCSPIQQSIKDKIKAATKQKVTEIISKFKSEHSDDDSKAVIEGSNEVVMGDVEQVKNLSIVARNHDHLSNFFDLLLLGLYIIGENDNITLSNTTFIEARKITPNLNTICDGAVSLRFDESSENSFLNEVFTFIGAKDKIISVYLSEQKNVVTIGGISSKYSQNGLSSFVRVKMVTDEKYGKLPAMQGLIFENDDEETNIDAEGSIVFSLSASYIAFPKLTIDKIIKQFFPSTLKCKINSELFLECLNNNRQDVDNIKQSSMNLDLDTSMIHFEIKRLILHQQKSKIIFNIKQAPVNYTIIGEPFFVNYYAYFDYGKDQIAFASRKLTLREEIISAVTIVHFIVVFTMLGCCFIATSEMSKKLYYRLFMKLSQKSKGYMKQNFKSYQPVQDENEGNQRDRLPRLEEIQGI